MDVELGQYLGLRQEVEHEEKKFQALKQEKYNQRLQREKSVARGTKLKALRAKKYSVAQLNLCCSKSHGVNSDAELLYMQTCKKVFSILKSCKARFCPSKLM